MNKMHLAESALNRLRNFMDDIEGPSPAQVDTMAAIMQGQDEMRGMLAEMKRKPKSVRVERGSDGRIVRAVPEYEDPLIAADGAQIDAALNSPTPNMPAAPGIAEAFVAEGLGLAPPSP